jgi:cupin 2 domain-containing protein
MPDCGNLLQDVPGRMDREVFQSIVSREDLRIERIVSHGHASPEGFWYQQVEAEWVVVLQGHARLRFDEGPVHELVPGSYVLIPAGLRHRVDWTDPAVPTVWLAIHFPS